MKVLFIGGTGTISTEISKLASKKGWEIYLLNRGNRKKRLEGFEGINFIKGDISNEEDIKQKLGNMKFDVVANFIVFNPEEVERDIRLFSQITSQYIFISTASVYQKPSSHYKITESTPIKNPHWEYSRKKIECENILMREYRENNFPVTIVRPSHTYDRNYIPLPVHGRYGSFQTIKRILDKKPVIVPGDGSTLWTLTHSRDFAKGFTGLMGNIHAIGEAFHITSDECLTWNQVYQCIGRALNIDPVLCHISSDFLVACNEALRGTLLGDKSSTTVFDNSKLKQIVPDFIASTRADTGIHESVSYALSSEELQVLDPEFDKWTDAVIAAHNNAAKSVAGMTF